MMKLTHDPLIERTERLLREMREEAERFLAETAWLIEADRKLREVRHDA